MNPVDLQAFNIPTKQNIQTQPPKVGALPGNAFLPINNASRLKFGLTQVWLSVANEDTFERERQNLIDQLEMDKSDIIEGKYIDQKVDEGSLARIVPRICHGPILQLIMSAHRARAIAANSGLKPIEKIALLLGRRIGRNTELTTNDHRHMQKSDFDKYWLVSEKMSEKVGHPHIRIILDEARLPLEGYLNLMVFLFERSLHSNDNQISIDPGTGTIVRGQELVYSMLHPNYTKEAPKSSQGQAEELAYAQRYQAVIRELSEDFLATNGITVIPHLSRSQIHRLTRDMEPSIDHGTIVINLGPDEDKANDWDTALKRLTSHPENGGGDMG